MKKSGKLAWHVVNLNITIDSLSTLQISVGIIALFEKMQPDTIIDFKWQKKDLLSSLKPLTGWGLQKFFWKFQREELNRDQWNDTKFNPPLFALVITFKNWIFYKSVKLPCGGCIFTSGSLLSHLQLSWSTGVPLRDFLQVSMIYLHLCHKIIFSHEVIWGRLMFLLLSHRLINIQILKHLSALL